VQNLIIKLRSVDSTNNYASKLLDTPSIEEGTVIWSQEQTRGKGQAKNSWESEMGKNLTFSLVLFPHFIKIEQQFYLSKAISLGVAGFLAEYIDHVSIKWPNDIYAGDKKIAGILIENSIYGDKIKSAVVGIGLNVNQEVFTNGGPNPVSMKQITGTDYPLENCLEVLLKSIDQQYERLRRRKLLSIDKDYFQLLYRLNKYADFACNGAPFKAKITGVEKTGEIVLEEKDGTLRKFAFKEMEYVI
jgi:BirA family transcriptional regulator, biotin operon repressor / biotin---[acetyl-CoA-carboxylase] ligase